MVAEAAPFPPVVHPTGDRHYLGGADVYPVDQRLSHVPRPLTFRLAFRPAIRRPTDDYTVLGTEVEDRGLGMPAHQVL